MNRTSESGQAPHGALRAATEALRQSEERMRLFVDAVRDYAIFLLDPSGRVVSWNKGAERLKGYRADEIRGRHFSIFYTQEDRLRGHPEHELRVALAEGSYAEEGWRVRKDGSRFWASVLITALHDELGRLYGFGKVTRDLTARKSAEESARRLVEFEAVRSTAATLHRATLAFASAMVRDDVARAVFETVLPVLGADGGSLAVRTPGTDELRLLWSHGYPAETLERLRSFSVRAKSPHADAAREGLPVVLSSRRAIEAAYPGLALRNGIEWLVAYPLRVRAVCIGVLGATSSTPQRGAPPHPLALAFADQCAIALDRALLFESEQAAKARAHFMAEASALLASSLDADVVLDRFARLTIPRLGDWCIVELVEGETTRLATVAHSDPAKVALARELRERFPPDRERHTGMYEVIRTGRPELHAEVTDEQLVAAARSPEELAAFRAVEIRSLLIVPLVARERAVGALTLASATPGRYTPADLEFVGELCGRAALAIENASLYQELRKAVRVRDDFMSIAGHEVRTPLAALQLHLQTISRSAARDPVLQGHAKLRERIAKALDNGDRLERLVAELLDVSRVTANRLKLEVEDLDLTQLVDEVVGRLREQAERYDSHLVFRGGGPLPGRWDRFRIEQVVSNLLTNALKYGRGKPVEVETAEDAGFAVVRVRDFGIGIDLVDQRRIFERFERAVSDRHYGGLGLGLWIARQIVEASGGTITVQSEPERGSRFTVRLPMAADVAP